MRWRKRRKPRCEHGVDKYGRVADETMLAEWDWENWTDEEGKRHRRIRAICRCGQEVTANHTWVSADGATACF